MKQLKLLFGFLCCGALVWTCVPTGTPSLFLNAIEDSTGARIDISATEGDGTIGKGVVTLTPSNGTLDQTSVTLDSFGAGSVRLDCNPSTDATCLTGRVVARWTPKNATAPVEEEGNFVAREDAAQEVLIRLKLPQQHGHVAKASA